MMARLLIWQNVRKLKWRCLILFVLALIVRGGLLATTQPDKLLTRWCPVCTDAVDYNQLALNLLRTGQYTLNNQLVAERPPLYPLFIAGIYAIAGIENFFAVRVLQIILSVITVLFISQIANRLFGYLAAWIAGGMMAIYPFFVAYSIELYSETLFTFLLSAAAWLLFPYPDRTMPTIRVSIAGGMLVGLSGLTREIGLFLLPALTLWFWFSQKKILAQWLIITWLAAGLVVGMWTLRNYLTWGKFILITTHTFTNMIHSIVNENHYYLDGASAKIPDIVPPTVENPFAYLGQVDQIAQEQYSRDLVFSYCSVRPANCVIVWARNLAKLISPVIEGKPIGVVLITSIAHLTVYFLGTWGLFKMSQTKEYSVVFFLLSWFAICLIVNAIAHAEIRYRLPVVDPYLMIMASYPIIRLMAAPNLKVS